jgi:hypothetical protein
VFDWGYVRLLTSSAARAALDLIGDNFAMANTLQP